MNRYNQGKEPLDFKENFFLPIGGFPLGGPSNQTVVICDKGPRKDMPSHVFQLRSKGQNWDITDNRKKNQH